MEPLPVVDGRRQKLVVAVDSFGRVEEVEIKVEEEWYNSAGQLVGQVEQLLQLDRTARESSSTTPTEPPAVANKSEIQMQEPQAQNEIKQEPISPVKRPSTPPQAPQRENYQLRKRRKKDLEIIPEVANSSYLSTSASTGHSSSKGRRKSNLPKIVEPPDDDDEVNDEESPRPQKRLRLRPQQHQTQTPAARKRVLTAKEKERRKFMEACRRRTATPEQTEQRRSWQEKSIRRHRANETPEQREARLARDRERKRRYYGERETAEQRELRLAKRRVYSRAYFRRVQPTEDDELEPLDQQGPNTHPSIGTETPEARQRRLARQREIDQKMKILGTETPEQHLQRLAKLRENNKKRISQETPEQHQRRLAKLRENNEKGLSKETPQERERRLAKLRENNKKRISQETPEQRQRRLAQVHENNKKRYKTCSTVERERRRVEMKVQYRKGLTVSLTAAVDGACPEELERATVARVGVTKGGKKGTGIKLLEQIKGIQELIRREEAEEQKYSELYKYDGKSTNNNERDLCTICSVLVEKRDMGLHMKYHAEFAHTTPAQQQQRS